MRQLDLSSADQRTIKNYLATKNFSARMYSLQYLLDRWLKIVTSGEQGYSLTIYNYQNDLTCREIISEIQNLLSEDGKQLLEPILDLVDRRFKAATRELKQPIYGDGIDWWYFRIPIRPGEELEEDLKKEGYT